MTTIYIDRKDVELQARQGALHFREPDGPRGSVPLSMIDRLVVRGEASLSTGTLARLAEAGIGMLFLSGRMSRRTAIVLGPVHNDVSRRLDQYRSYCDSDNRRAWSHELVVAKLRAQCRLLQRALVERPDRRLDLSRGIRRLDQALARLSGAQQSAGIDSLRGIEGAAAAAYFEAFTSLFPPSLEFTGRNKRPPRDPVNACLSLAYTLVHFEAVAASYAAGLDPLLGLYHEPAFGRESLASDLIEPLRPHADAWVWSLFRERVLTGEHFHNDKGAVLLGKTGRQYFYTRFENFAHPLRRLLRLEAFRTVKRLQQSSPDTSQPEKIDETLVS